MESLGGRRRGALQQGKGLPGEGLPNRGGTKMHAMIISLGKSISVTTVTFFTRKEEPEATSPAVPFEMCFL